MTIKELRAIKQGRKFANHKAGRKGKRFIHINPHTTYYF